MKWKDHDRWAQKLGISKEVYRYVNNLIDAIAGGKTLPQEYIDFVHKESIRIAETEGSEKRAGILPIILSQETLKHDSARSRRTSGAIASDIQLKFLKGKGEDYVKAWYLHHALDYLYDRRYDGKSIESLFIKYEENRPVTFSREIIEFLKSNTNLEELKKDLNL
ncbi:MAG: hypothetical protein MOIL_00571 [Candidatus Methanolliviera sp. GoM_oil]|nr:MAG: hypothetical protein MOIL_00571 [Candidatus Methanolliviera sp. GoM_oil]